jgi:hypothetical protein
VCASGNHGGESGHAVAVDPEKVEVITKMSKRDLMEDDNCSPSIERKGWKVQSESQ